MAVPRPHAPVKRLSCRYSPALRAFVRLARGVPFGREDLHAEVARDQGAGRFESDRADAQVRHAHLALPATAGATAGIAKRESSSGGLTRTVSTVRRCNFFAPSVRVSWRRGMRRPSAACQSW